MTILIRSTGSSATKRVLRNAGAFTVTAAAALMALAGSVAAQTAPPRSLAPSTDFSKICAPASTPKLTRDWSKWQKSQPVSDPEEMYSAAVKGATPE